MNTSDTTNTCANCGKEGSDVINTCNKCKSVMYCNAACKKRHRHKHKKECEEHLKRAAEHAAKLHDEKLFKQPPPLEDCPICMIRLPTAETGSKGYVYMVCCGKVICSGCVHAFRSRAAKAGRQKEDDICPFCRTPPPTSDEEMIKRYEKRMEMNDAQAIFNMGGYYSQGLHGLPQNRAKAFELWHRAAELGHADAYCMMGFAYKNGAGVEMDKKMSNHYYDLSAMNGILPARHYLGLKEWDAGNYDRALRHFKIAVKDGYPVSLESIKSMYLKGFAAKDDYTEALRSYQAYLDEVKNDQRDEAAVARSGSNSN